jgi:hypothetical protein
MSDEDELLSRFLSGKSKFATAKELKKEEQEKIKKELIKDEEISLEKFLKIQEQSKISATRIITVSELLDFINTNMEKKYRDNQFLLLAKDAINQHKFQEFFDYVNEFKNEIDLRRNQMINSALKIIEALLEPVKLSE